jgi:hypothetical protein
MVPFPQVGKTLALGDVSRLPGVSYKTEERFQSRCPTSLESCHRVGKFRLPAHVLLLAGGKLVLVEYALNIRVKQALKFCLGTGDDLRSMPLSSTMKGTKRLGIPTCGLQTLRDIMTQQ